MMTVTVSGSQALLMDTVSDKTTYSCMKVVTVAQIRAQPYPLSGLQWELLVVPNRVIPITRYISTLLSHSVEFIHIR